MNREDALAAIRAERDRQAGLWAEPHTHGQGGLLIRRRPGFPEVAEWDGPAALYRRSELAEWQEGKVRVPR